MSNFTKNADNTVVLRASVSDTERIILTDDERDFFDNRDNRDLRRMMTQNSARFL